MKSQCVKRRALSIFRVPEIEKHIITISTNWALKYPNSKDPWPRFDLKDISSLIWTAALGFPCRGCGNYDLHDEPRTGTATHGGGRPIRVLSIVRTAPWQELQCHKVCDERRVTWLISLTWDQVKSRCMQADGDKKIKIDLVKYQERKGTSPRILQSSASCRRRRWIKIFN